MSYIIQCSCGQQMTAEPSLSGREVICPGCRERVVVPPPPDDPQALPLASPSAHAEQPEAGTTVAPHRAPVILALGIVALVIICLAPFVGTMAWVMGNSDLAAMRDGRMDRLGEGMTRAGRICGIVSLCVIAGTVLICALAVFALAGLGAFN